MSKTSDAQQALFLALCIFREARGEPIDSKLAMAWSVRNRVDRPSWWGNDYLSVVTKKLQYSSMTDHGDPNLVVWPGTADAVWNDCMNVAEGVIDGVCGDPTGGATHYFDKSLDDCPPAWAELFQHTVDVGRLHFYKGW